MRMYTSRRSAFTLIELLVVIAIIALLLAILLPYHLRTHVSYHCTPAANEIRVQDFHSDIHQRGSAVSHHAESSIAGKLVPSMIFSSSWLSWWFWNRKKEIRNYVKNVKQKQPVPTYAAIMDYNLAQIATCVECKLWRESDHPRLYVWRLIDRLAILDEELRHSDQNLASHLDFIWGRIHAVEISMNRKQRQVIQV